MSTTTLVQRETPPVPIVGQEVFDLLDAYLAAVRAGCTEVPRPLIELVGRAFDENYQLRGADQREIEEALTLARTFWEKCLAKRDDFVIVPVRIAEPGRAVALRATWMTPGQGGSHERRSSPRELKPVALAHFVRISLESVALAA